MPRLTCLLPLVLFAAPIFAAEPPEAVSVTIAIPVHHNHRSLNEYDHFHVAVKNVSDKPLRVWTDRYSWGYDNLSFELIDDDGKVTRIDKQPRGWDKNYPDWLALEPGESYILTVKMFSGDLWKNVPTKPAGGAGPKRVKLRAVYEIHPDEESTKLDVWTGKVASPVATYAIW